jgi:prepilin signal peptidase PulO-like enzyme (type II secretory pathway)
MIPLLLVILGLVLGSFVNALVWRLHAKKDWINDRSECVHCHHKLGPLDLIPVASWVLLKGKCRYCHKKIDDNPLVELALPLLFIISYSFWPGSLQGSNLIEFVFWLAFLVGFMVLAVYDLRWYLLPDKVVFPLIILAGLQVFAVAIYEGDWKILTSGLLGVVAISGIFYVLYQLSKGQWIGGGDVKLGIVLGLLAGGLLEGFLVLFAASVAGVIAALPMIVKGQATRKTQLPFGPLLILGLIFVKLFGSSIIGWYTGLIYG